MNPDSKETPSALPLIVKNTGGAVSDYIEYFNGVDLKQLNINLELAMKEVAGNWQEVAQRIAEIVKFCKIKAAYSLLEPLPFEFLPLQRELIKNVLTTPLGIALASEYKSRYPAATDDRRDTAIMLEFVHSSDPTLQEVYRRVLGIPIFNQIPQEFLLQVEGKPVVGLAEIDPLFHSNDSCFIEGCSSSWAGGYRVISPTGRIWYVNDGIQHFVEAHHLFEVYPYRQLFEQKPFNPAAITPREFYAHFMSS